MNLHQFFPEALLKIAGVKLPDGLAISPAQAARCFLSDPYRTAAFLGGVTQAIEETWPNRIFYAGCGPLAPWFFLTADRFPNVHWTLVDWHRGSVSHVRRLVHAAGYADRCLVGEADAAKMSIADQDMIICECMDAGLVVEPQVPICVNLLEQNPMAELIPRRIILRAGTETNWFQAFFDRETLSTIGGLQWETDRPAGKPQDFRLRTHVAVYKDWEVKPDQSPMTATRGLTFRFNDTGVTRLAYEAGKGIRNVS